MSEAHEHQAAEPCRTCGAQLAPGQDWCLNCGSAAPGRLRRRPGARAAATTVAITLALAGGAVAASYAALSKDPVSKGAIAYPYQATVPIQAQAEEPAETAAKTPTKSSSDDEKKTKTTSTRSTAAPKPAPTKKEAPAPPKPVLLDISEKAGSLYDPFARSVATPDDPSDPVAVLDDDKETSWAVTAGGEGDLQVGYVIDLKRPRSLEYLTLLTDTPGFRLEIFAADADELPPEIGDSRWASLKQRDNVDGTAKEKGKAGDGKEKITFSDGAQKYRYLLLWATTPAPVVAPDPPSRTVRIFDLKVYGAES